MTESQPPSGGTPSSPQRSAQRPSAVLPVEVAELAVSIGLVPDAGAGRVEVTGISLDSRTVQPGDLYLALPGERVHGASFAAAAIAAGAAAVVTDEEGAQLLAAVPPVPVLVVENPRSVAGGLAQRIYRHSPVELFGLTGTNG
ncbi:MAG: Mur ligase domain-containing protein, partial [Renibacterium salmoninarum]|nr:Mur ligase domain-containing protein [Renibacterium salmoninarum]